MAPPGAQRFYEARLAVRFPMLFSVYTDVCEWFDDASGQVQIEVRVTNPTWGPLFGYRGSFAVKWKGVRPGTAPAHLRPRREGHRECRALVSLAPPKRRLDLAPSSYWFSWTRIAACRRLAAKRRT